MPQTHDKIRKQTQRNEKEASNQLTKNGKYFVAPQQNNENFTTLLTRLAAEGAGRPVDRDGFPDGPWTAELLTDAICAIPANKKGVDLRSVQLWLQDNDHGIGTNNLRWLARIFGCDDPDETSKWQAVLRASKDQSSAERKAKLQAGDAAPMVSAPYPSIDYDMSLEKTFGPSPIFPKPEIQPDTRPKISGISFAMRCEQMFSGSNHLVMPIAIWGGLAVLWFLAIILGVHNVTYSPVEGVAKQIGFIWSPGWNLGEPIFLPIMLILCRSLINGWKGSDRPTLISYGEIAMSEKWYDKVRSSTSSFWSIFLISFLLIFLLQWAGVYLLPLLENRQDVPMIDWMLVALVRPDVVSTDAAIFVSFLGFLYSGLIYWFLFTALLFLFCVCGDFAAICTAKDDRHIPIYNGLIFTTGIKIMQTVYRCTILGIMVALCIKLNAAYLVSDASSITAWLWDDAMIFLGYRSNAWTWINESPSPFFTSFLLLFLLCFVFGACLFQVKSGIDKTPLFAQDEGRATRTWIRMCAVLGILSLGYIAIGQFYGFSLLLGLSTTAASASLLWGFEPRKGNGKGN